MRPELRGRQVDLVSDRMEVVSISARSLEAVKTDLLELRMLSFYS